MSQRTLKRASIIAGVVWLVFLVPGMVAGGLWSGTLPLWPPVASAHLQDQIVWAMLFGLSYGLPLLSVALWAISRR